jgi:hypothetical protein
MKEVLRTRSRRSLPSRLADSPCVLVTASMDGPEHGTYHEGPGLRDATQSAYMSSKKHLRRSTPLMPLSLPPREAEADQSDKTVKDLSAP